MPGKTKTKKLKSKIDIGGVRVKSLGLSLAAKTIPIGESLPQFSGLVSFQKKFSDFKSLTVFGSATSEFSRQLAQIRSDIQKFTKGFIFALGSSVAQAKKADLIERAGWLPHYTTPIDEINAEDDAVNIDRIISAHYQENWSSIKEDFKKKIYSYNIDDEAKSTFCEALNAHEGGLYRAVVRMLFPEIERVARKEVYKGKDYEEKDGDNESHLFWLSPDELRSPPRQITSMHGLREALSHMPIISVSSFDFGMNLYHRVDGHLYRSVGGRAKDIQKYIIDPVPNRHASLHGLVSYSTLQNSINMLIMTDFMFHIVDRMKLIIIPKEGSGI